MVFQNPLIDTIKIKLHKFIKKLQKLTNAIKSLNDV